METSWTLPERRIYSVSELTQNIKEFLEEAYPFVWIAGEVSDFRTPASGHLYFTLKDEKAQMRAVMFRGLTRHLKFAPQDGMAVIAMGRLNVYEARGVYQIIVEYLEPGGVGALQVAFEQLKERLAAEGLFDTDRKRSLPFLPRRIAVVTSPTGAVIRDILHVVHRRFPNVDVVVSPARVQGDGAAEEISQALELANESSAADVIVLARGGGSLEDLQAFNSEAVARAIFSSRLPVVSAIGHETDVTIADFVADVRAPTPSAAAELVVPEKRGLVRRLGELETGLERAITRHVRVRTERIEGLNQRLIDPRRRLADYRLRLDDLTERIERGYARVISESRYRLRETRDRLGRCSPLLAIDNLNRLVERFTETLFFEMQSYLRSRRADFLIASSKLNTLSPLAVLDRGYSITRSLPGRALVKDVRQVDEGQQVAVTVARGEMVCRVLRKQDYGKTNV